MGLAKDGDMNGEWGDSGGQEGEVVAKRERAWYGVRRSGKGVPEGSG